MKKFVVIFLLFQFASSNAFAEQLVKIPVMLSHYFYHSQEHEDQNNLLGFLQSHYYDQHDSNKKVGDNHQEDKDCNLPFNQCGSCCIDADSSVEGFVASYISADFAVLSLTLVTFLPQQDFFQSFDLCNIWQPPKIS
ncbi:MAG: hypothetical protein JNJ40_12700 [Bacteroidia bacterium]|nr:hypothetical protein [Bacteroidia bacterium]